MSVYGPGVESGVTSQKPTHFVIDCKQAGPGEWGTFVLVLS